MVVNNITNADNIALVRDAQAGDKNARDALIIANTNLVHSIAQGLLIKSNLFDYDDLFQEGIIALSNSVYSFDLSIDVKFSTYAYKVIRSKIIDFINSNTSHFSEPKGAALNRIAISKLISEKEAKGESIPSSKEIAETLGITLNSVAPFTERKCVNLFDTAYENHKYFDIIPDKSPTPDEICEKQMLFECLAKTMENALNPDENYILINYFGFKGEVKKMPAIARDLGVSTQNISVKYNRALRKLKHALTPHVACTA